MNLLDKLRLNYGMHWPGRYPPVPTKTIVVLSVIVCTMLYIVQLKQQINDTADHWSAQMASCLNGTWRGVANDGIQIACLPAEHFDPSQHRSRHHGT